MKLHAIICCLLIGLLLSVSLMPASQVLAAVPDQAQALPAASGGGGLLQQLWSFITDFLLGPLTKTASLPASVPKTASTAIHPNLAGKVIVIDPGHGGSNPGAVANNTRESDNNLAVSVKLRDKLSAAGATVILTRSQDTTVAAEGSSLSAELQARLDIAERSNADIFVSIHTNENDDPGISGAAVYYPADASSQLASSIQKALLTSSGAADRGVLPATFYVLRNNKVPCALVEMGFISNPAEAARLHSDNYRQQVAEGVFQGIAGFFSH